MIEDYKFKFGDSWLDIWERPFQKGRITKAFGGTQLVDFLIDPGASTSGIPKSLLDGIMGKMEGNPEEYIAPHGVTVNTHWYNAEFEFCISIKELNNKLVCHRFPGPILAILKKDHGIIGMDALKLFNVKSLSFDFNNERNRLWKPYLESNIYSEYIC